MPMLPGRSYRVFIQAAEDATFAATTFYVGIYWRKTDGTIASLFPVSAAGTLDSTWREFSGVFTAPADLVYAWAYVYFIAGGAGSVYWTNLSVREMAAAELVVDGTITAAKIAANTITAGQIAANTITAGQIAAGAISASELAAGAVTTAKLAAGAVTANEIAASTITGGKLVANTITAGLLATSGLITASAQINSGLINTAHINDLQVTTLKIGDNAVTIPVYSYAAAAVTLSSTAVDVATLTITREGMATKIDFATMIKSTAAAGNASVAQFSVYRGATLLIQFNVITLSWLSAFDVRSYTFIDTDTGTGASIYKVTAALISSSPGAQVQSRFLGAVQFKK